MKLLIIESLGKIKKLKQILGSDWNVKASLGHIRELAKDGDDKLGFEINDNRIDCRFVPKDAKSQKIINELKQSARQADPIFFASDPDREGYTKDGQKKVMLKCSSQATDKKHKDVVFFLTQKGSWWSKTWGELDVN